MLKVPHQSSFSWSKTPLCLQKRGQSEWSLSSRESQVTVLIEGVGKDNNCDWLCNTSGGVAKQVSLLGVWKCGNKNSGSEQRDPHHGMLTDCQSHGHQCNLENCVIADRSCASQANDTVAVPVCTSVWCFLAHKIGFGRQFLTPLVSTLLSCWSCGLRTLLTTRFVIFANHVVC